MRPTIKPLGIGDLKVVKQKLARYEAGEVAHIENVMARETRNRKHRRLRQFEELVVLEQERIEESLRDLQSTERFELENELQRTVRSETSLQAGLDLSADFGQVKLSAFAKYSTNASQEESERNSTKFAKDITSKTVARLVEKVRQERRTRTLEESEEINEHGFVPGPENNSGIYRWVDKYYRAKILNYGKRLMYEFLVPEPAALYLFATQHNLDSKVMPVKPTVPTAPGSVSPLKPYEISRTNYLTLVQQYNASGVQPPPPQSIFLTKSITVETSAQGSTLFSNDELKVPKGYKAFFGMYNWNATTIGSSSVVIHIGINRILSGAAGNQNPPLVFLGESGNITISGFLTQVLTFVLSLDVRCHLLPEYEEKWQLETYTAIMNAHYKALSDYEEQVAAAQIRQGVAIGGQNPAINREIEKQELKRACIAMYTSYSNFVAPSVEVMLPYLYPEINYPQAETNALMINFFEPAFDWKNMTYEFLPYFWGNKFRWIDMLALENTDPIFEHFLRAGAARVVVPVNPTYVDAVLYYQLTGSFWSGGPVPPLTGILDPDAQLYNSYIEELADVDELPDIEQDVEINPEDKTTWLIKVPTSLVWLQSDTALPDFES